MIELISNWAKNIIVAVAIVTILEILLPNNKNKKYIKVLMGIYIIFCMISPFINDVNGISNYNLDTYVEKYVNDSKKEMEKINQKSMDMRLEKLYVQELEKTIAKEIEDLGYCVKNCKIDAVLNTEAANAGINKIELKINKSIQLKKSKVQVIDPIDIQNRNNLSKNEIKKIIKEYLFNKYEISDEKIKIDVY